MRLLLTPACLGLALNAMLSGGCGGYGGFSLPRQVGGPAATVFQWSPAADPVVSPGKTGEWDSVDVLNPSIAHRGGTFYNMYSGFNGGAWSSGMAISSDGNTWTKLGMMLSPGPATWEGNYIAANGSLLILKEEFLYWYQAGSPPGIGLARSRNGRTWLKNSQAVLTPGPRGSWDERGVADPYVIQVSGQYYMYYLGEDRARRQRLGLARSEDGVHWQRLRSNPVLELGEAGTFDENGLGEPAVFTTQGRYWMLYTGRDRREYRRIGQAWSLDGVNWHRLPASAVLSGNQAWNSKVVCDPSVLVEEDRIRVWYGGGDVAHPVENIHGQIGLAFLEPIGANLAK